MSVRREHPAKHYVKVRADFLLDGRIRPLMFREEDGPTCVIDAIEDEREAPSLKAGGQGIRYICRVNQRRYTLFHDDPYWFIEVDIKK